MSDEPQSTAAWRTGAAGERQFAAWLNRDLSEHGVVLHDRNLLRTKGNIDHLVIAPSGIWIIDAKNCTGKVERRDKSAWFNSDDRLYGFYSTPATGELSLCHRGDDVAALQRDLRTLGYYDGETSARFDVRTRQAVRAFQRIFQDELAEDGLAGPNTLRVLAREVGERATVAATQSTAWDGPPPSWPPPPRRSAITRLVATVGQCASLAL